MHYLITGGAGFIGSNMADRLLELGASVTVYDNFVTGHRQYLKKAQSYPTFTLIEGSLEEEEKLTEAMKNVDFVFHFAANADVRMGLSHPGKDLEQNTINTFRVLEAMRANGVKKIGFSSTGSIYGEAEVIPTPENASIPVQTSLYGASKMACEGLIEAYCEGFDFQAWIFRFVSILGERYPHGHVIDFYRKLKKDPSVMEVLGDGHQKKSYLYIGDCLNAILTAVEKSVDRVNIFNLGTDEYCEVNDSIGWITQRLGLEPKLQYTGGERGWVGDNPFIYLDTKKIRALGWKPELTIKEAVVRTTEFIMENEWLLQEAK